MGNFRIVLRGSGAHHNNNNSTDANLLMLAVCAVFSALGHTIEAATFQVEGRAAENLLNDDGTMKPVPPKTAGAFAEKAFEMLPNKPEKKIEASPVPPGMVGSPKWSVEKAAFDAGRKIEERTFGSESDSWKHSTAPCWDDPMLEFRVVDEKESPLNGGLSAVADTPGVDAGSGEKSGTGNPPPASGPVVNPEEVRDALNAPIKP